MTVSSAHQWTVLFYDASGTDPAEMFRTMVERGRLSANVEPLAVPIEQVTIRADSAHTDAALLLERGALRARLLVRASP